MKRARIVDVARAIWDLSSDGCSMAPDLDIGACCRRHDFHYRNGTVSRHEADALLRECITAHGYRLLPWLYWAGVRLFGRRSYRWDRRTQYLATRRHLFEESVGD